MKQVAIDVDVDVDVEYLTHGFSISSGEVVTRSNNKCTVTYYD